MNISVTNEEKFADAIVVIYNEFADKLITLYSDKTFFIWELEKVEKMDKINVMRHDMVHSGSIYSMDLIQGKDGILKLATCSDDKTIRYWNFKVEDFLSDTKCKYLLYLIQLKIQFWFYVLI